VHKNFSVVDNVKKLSLVQDYFQALFYTNAEVIPKSLAAEYPGWKDSGKCFILGNRAYTADGTTQIHVLDKIIGNLYSPAGSLEKYVSGNKTVIETFPIARFMMYAGCASVILEQLGLKSVVVFLRGQSTTGKSKLCMLGVSPFVYLIKTADSTKVYQELDAVRNDGIPIFYDEATGKEDRLNSIMYMLANGTGKGRGKQHGDGITHGKSWKTVIFYNGENPILTESDNVGKYVRVIEIKNPVTKSPVNKVLMDSIEKTCSENHGILADLFLNEFFKRRDKLIQMYEENLAKFEQTNDAGERLKKHFAAFATAGQILEDIFSDIGIQKADAFEVVNEFFQEVVIRRPIIDEYKRALTAVWNWVVSNEGTRVINTTDLKAPDVKSSEVWVWVTEAATKELTVSASHRICFVPAKLKAVLKELGFNADKVIEAWAEKKIIDSSPRKGKDGKCSGKPRTELSKTINGRVLILSVWLPLPHGRRSF
jgi:uncharacterized protein (DUF927 family)